MADKLITDLTGIAAVLADNTVWEAHRSGQAGSEKHTGTQLKAYLADGSTIATLFPHGSLPTVTLAATLDTISDLSTPLSVTPVLDFDGAAQDEHAEWLIEIPIWYTGGGLTFVIKYAMAGTDADDVQFEVRALYMADTADLDTDLGMDTQTGTDITDTPTGTQNAMMVTASGAVTHANAGSPAAGGLVRIRITRDFDHAANTDDAQLVCVHVTETP